MRSGKTKPQVNPNPLFPLPFLSLAFFLLFPCLLLAQVSYGGKPYSFTHELKKSVTPLVMPPLDLEKVYAEDSEDLARGKPLRFGYPFDVELSLDNSGTWEEVEGGGRVWRLCIQCPGAYSINLIFSEFFLPQTAKLFVYDNERSTVLGAFTTQSNKPHGKFATAPTKGDTCWIEYIEPQAVKGKGRVTVGRIVHGYRNIFFGKVGYKNFNDSGFCQINVRCPEGDPYAKQIRAVGMILCGGGLRCCTGVLLNNVREDRTPYFLTSASCLQGHPPSTWVVLFNYESPDCSNKDGPINYSISGARLVAQNQRSDSVLVELNETPPPEYNVYYAGWSREAAPSAGTFCVHHPSGDIKKIAIDDQAPGQSAIGQVLTWVVRDWEKGAMEQGSMGAPLFDKQGHVIGQLSLFNSSCSTNGYGPDYFGRFDVAWSGSSPTKRLRDWLDPDDTDPTTLEGLEPYEPPTLTILSPKDGEVLFGDVEISVEASHRDGISKVEFYIAGELVHTASSEPYQYLWDTSSSPVGEVSVRVAAVSNSGIRAEQSIKVKVSRDCNSNGVADLLDLENGTSKDCNGNLIPDECDLQAGTSNDCNGNAVPDECDLKISQFGFKESRSVSLEAEPLLLKEGDLNGDGVNDLIVAATNPPSLMFVVKEGEEQFRVSSVSLSGKPLSLAASDLDNDGDLDVAVGIDTLRDNLITAIGSGDGTIEKTFRQSVGTIPRSITYADLEGDGDLDLVVACEGSGELAILFNFGNAAFFVDLLPTEGAPVLVAASDFDGDSDADIVYAEKNVSSLFLLRNTGKGKFSDPELINAVGEGGSFGALAALDLSGDGIPDIALIEKSQGAFLFLEGRGNGSFADPVQVEAPLKASSFAFGDLNLDGLTDIVLASESESSLSVVLNEGGSSFRNWGNLPLSVQVLSLATVDVTGSVLPDIVIAPSGSKELDVLANLALPPHSSDCNNNNVPDECDIESGSASDCNGNMIPDQCDIENGTSLDENSDGIPDECQAQGTPFKRGDPNMDGGVNIADAIAILGYTFGGQSAPPCLKSADLNDDGSVNIADAIYLLGYVFGGGPPPAEPFSSCGTDPTEDNLTCSSFPPCQKGR